MQLSFDKIRQITRGAAFIEENEGYLSFNRFSKPQLKAYEVQTRSADFARKSLATSGVRFEFTTNSTTLSFKGRVTGGSSRKFFYFDVYANDALIAHLGMDDNGVHDIDYTVELGEGYKDVRVYFPWSARTELSSVEVDDSSAVAPMPKKPLMIAFGDSITQGYDAMYPSLSYASILADRMGVEMINKAIGGETFCPDIIEEPENLDPKYITVAYGTNDWSKCSTEVFETTCREFYEKLSAEYPNAKIFAITPIWRGDYKTREPEKGDFFSIARHIEKVCEPLENVTVIDGFDLTPELPEFYSDKRLHPNDIGFLIHGNNLYEKIRKYLD